MVDTQTLKNIVLPLAFCHQEYPTQTPPPLERAGQVEGVIVPFQKSVCLYILLYLIIVRILQQFYLTEMYIVFKVIITCLNQECRYLIGYLFFFFFTST